MGGVMLKRVRTAAIHGIAYLCLTSGALAQMCAGTQVFSYQSPSSLPGFADTSIEGACQRSVMFDFIYSPVVTGMTPYGTPDALGRYPGYNCHVTWLYNGSQRNYPVSPYYYNTAVWGNWSTGYRTSADSCVPTPAPPPAPPPAPDPCSLDGRRGGHVDASFGNPISARLGANQQFNTDWRSGLDRRFGLVRQYSSLEDVTLSPAAKGFGTGWSVSWMNTLSQQGTGNWIVYLHGAEWVHFEIDGGVAVPSGPAHPYSLVLNDTAYGGLHSFSDGSGRVELYDLIVTNVFGLAQVIWPDGYTQTFLRDVNGRVEAVEDNRGQRAELTWTDGLNTLQPSLAVVTEVAFDVEYDGVTFDPDAVVTLGYTTPTAYPGDLALSSVETAAPGGPVSRRFDYTYAGRIHGYPFKLIGISDGRQGPGGMAFDYTTFQYANSTSSVRPRAISTARPGGVNDFAITRPTTETAVVTNPLGLETTYTTDFIGGQPRVTQIEGEATTYCLPTDQTFDYTPNTGAPEGYIYEATHRNGAVTEYERDSRGLLLTQTEDATGTNPRVTEWTWDSTLRLPLTRTTEMLEETFTYTGTGQIATYSQTDVLTGSPNFNETRTWTYGYTTLASGLRVLTSIDGPGTGMVNDVTTLVYTAEGRLSQVLDPNGLLYEILEYNELGLPSYICDIHGFLWRLAYDSQGRLIEAEFMPDTAQSETYGFTYDIAGLILSGTDARSRTWSFEYDQARRLVEIQAPAGETISYTYNAMNNVTETRISNEASVTTLLQQSSFDELGRLLQTIGALGQISGYSHDVEDQLSGVTDPLSFTTSFDYDPLLRLVEMTDRESYTTAYEYDDGDNLTVYEDERELVTTFAYNGFGEVVQMVSPDRGTWSFSYDLRGLVTSVTDGRGVISTYAYDDSGRILSRTFPSQPALDQTYTYHTSSTAPWNFARLAAVEDQVGVTAFAFSPQTGNIATETRTIDGVSYEVAYDWQVRGELNRITYPSGGRLNLSYDGNGALLALEWEGIDPLTSSLLPPQPVIEDMLYAPFGGLRSATYGDGGEFTATYDLSYRLTALHDVRSSVDLRDVAYAWTLRDDLLSVTDNLTPALDEDYGYSSRQQVETAEGPWGELAWLYDGVGNRTEQSHDTGGGPVTDVYTYPGGSNRLQSIALGVGGSRGLTHDTMGNVTADSQSGQNYVYTYDAAGRMATVTLNSVLQAEYAYNFMGQQVRRELSASGDVIHAIHNTKGQRIAEYLFDPLTSTSSLIREYIWAGDLIVGLFEDGNLYFVRTDHIGRPSFATDDTGAKVWEASYRPFGEVEIATGTPIALRFPGQWFQAESGLHQNWMRDYDPTTGRYLQADPLGLIDGSSVYGYALQNPGRWTDPTGQAVPLVPILAGIGALAGYFSTPEGCSPVLNMLIGAGAGALSGYASVFMSHLANIGWGGQILGSGGAAAGISAGAQALPYLLEPDECCRADFSWADVALNGVLGASSGLVTSSFQRFRDLIRGGPSRGGLSPPPGVVISPRENVGDLANIGITGIREAGDVVNSLIGGNRRDPCGC